MIKERLYAIIQTILIGVFIYAAINIFGIANNYNKGDKIYTESQEKYFVIEQETDDKTSDKTDENQKYILDLAQLKEINPDIVAWIYIDDTKVSYPLLQCDNNDKYLKQTYNNIKSDFGSIFIDFRNSADMSDRHSIIYGHNTKNGSMFGSLKKYKDANYFKQHPKISIIYAEKTYEYEIFSVYTTLVSGPAYINNFNNDDEFISFINATAKLSVIDTGIKPNIQDKIITLSTCTSRSPDERFVVHARLASIIQNENSIEVDKF